MRAAALFSADMAQCIHPKMLRAILVHRAAVRYFSFRRRRDQDGQAITRAVAEFPIGPAILMPMATYPQQVIRKGGLLKGCI